MYNLLYSEQMLAEQLSEVTADHEGNCSSYHFLGWHLMHTEEESEDEHGTMFSARMQRCIEDDADDAHSRKRQNRPCTKGVKIELEVSRSAIVRCESPVIRCAFSNFVLKDWFSPFLFLQWLAFPQNSTHRITQIYQLNNIIVFLSNWNIFFMFQVPLTCSSPVSCFSV